MDPSITTTISMTTTVSRDNDTTSSITSLVTTTSSMNSCTIVITDPITITVTQIDMIPRSTGNPADDTCKFSNTCS